MLKNLNCTELEPVPTQLKLGLSEINLDTELIESGADLGLEHGTSVSYSQGNCTELKPVGTQLKLGLSEMILDAELIESGNKLGFKLGTSVSYSQGDVGCGEINLMLLLHWSNNK